MCGIVGFVGNKKSTKNVINGLKKLEYRGYDSWGIALKEKNGLKLIKKVGKISSVNAEQFTNRSLITIGHTRWATHGKVNEANAHPHIDCKKEIAVVHNGIIENYEELKKDLEKNGHQFISQTDTEVVPHLIEENLNQKKTKTIIQAIKLLKGNFALEIIFKDDNKIYAVAKRCPLIIGLGDNGNYIASDVLAFDSSVKKIIFIGENQLAEIGKEIKIIDIKNNKNIKPKIITIDNLSKEVTLGNFKHFLFKEINEQPEIIGKIAQMDEREIETNAALIRNSIGTFFVACGTAYHAGLVGSYMFAKNAKMHINVISAGEFPNFKSFLTERTLMFAISQSGETADVLEAVRAASQKKAKIFSLVNNPNSTLARLSDVKMITPAGPEIAVLSTKAFTSQIGILFLLSQAISGNLPKARQILNECSFALRFSLDKKNIEKLKKVASKIKNAQHLFTIGRSSNYPTALEAALKIKEVSYIHAEGYAGADLKHGPIALIEKGTPCIVFVANDEVHDEILSNAMEIKSRGGYIIGVSPENNEVFDYWIKVVDIPEVSPIINIVPMQILAYFLAVEKGLDPDKPRNLAKSVTVK